MKTLTLALDWTPNPNHIGFFVAQEQEFYQKLGITVQIVDPSSDNYAVTPAKKVEQGEAQLALCPLESVISYQTKNCPFHAVAIATLFKEDLSEIAVLENSAIKRPRDLDGRSYASYKARYEDEIVRQMVVNDGGKGIIKLEYPEKLGIWETVLKEKYDATWIFSNWEGEHAKSKGVKLRGFRLADFGIPYGYSPVIMASKKEVLEEKLTYGKFLKASKQGFLFAKKYPEEAVSVLSQHIPKHESHIDLLVSHLKTIPAYGPDEIWGRFEEERVEIFLNWLEKTGLETSLLTAKEICISDIDF